MCVKISSLMKTIDEILNGIVSKVTYHNQTTGWSVLRVHPLNAPQQQETVTVHQTKVFAGATMEFIGAWTIDGKYGRQFKAMKAIEKKPATTASIEKYLGSGLIKGVGPKTAKKIVKYFKQDTLEIFESNIHRLTEVPGIASKKLDMIESAWTEHKAIRDVMMFLQHHGISTLFSVKIYKKYSNDAIKIVTENPYQLANDFYGIGFFSADKVALSLGLAPDSQQRIIAAIKHVLAASREQGHCYLTLEQINAGVMDLIEINLGNQLLEHLSFMEIDRQIKTRIIKKDNQACVCYYSKTLFYDEQTVAKKIIKMGGEITLDAARVASWIAIYCEKKSVAITKERFAMKFQRSQRTVADAIWTHLKDLRVLDHNNRLSHAWHCTIGDVPLPYIEERVAAIGKARTGTKAKEETAYYNRTMTALNSISEDRQYAETISRLHPVTLFRPDRSPKSWASTGRVTTHAGRSEPYQVKPWDVSTYSDLNNHAESDDGLDHDHIPSTDFLNTRKKQLLTAKGIASNDDKTDWGCVAISHDLHKQGVSHSESSASQIKRINKPFFDEVSDYLNKLEMNWQHTLLIDNEYLKALGAFRYLHRCNITGKFGAVPYGFFNENRDLREEIDQLIMDRLERFTIKKEGKRSGPL